jgi:hypothetical protein
VKESVRVYIENVRPYAETIMKHCMAFPPAHPAVMWAGAVLEGRIEGPAEIPTPEDLAPTIEALRAFIKQHCPPTQ